MCSRIALVFIFFFSVGPVYAARNLSIAADKTSLAGNEELTITASASGFTDGETIYIKGAFFKSGSTNYFGYTQSGDTWVKNSATNTTQRSITIGPWDGMVKLRSDFDDSGFTGEGDYGLKVAFYYLTSGGNLSSINWSANALSVYLNAPDPTPTPTPTPDNTPTPTPIPTGTPTPTKTPTPTPVRTPTPTGEFITTPTPEITEAQVLGFTDEVASQSTPSAKTRPLIPIIISLLLVGVGLAILSLVFLWQKRHTLKTS